MLNEMMKNFAVGGFLFGDQNLQSKFVEGLYKQTDSATFEDCRYTYNTAVQNGAYSSYLDQVNYEADLNDTAINAIENEIVQGKTGGGFNVNNMLKAAQNIYKKPIKAPTNINILMSNYIPRPILSSGNVLLDSILGTKNGIEAGRVYVFASKGKGGKSLVLQNYATYFSNNYKVLYISLENDEADISKRQQLIGSASFDVIYDTDITISNINEYSTDYDIIFVDYIARIKPEKKYESMYEQYGDFVNQLHNIASTSGKTFITAAQLTRAALSNITNNESWENDFMNIDQDALAGSMEIVRNADAIIITMKHDDKQYFHNIASRTNIDYEGIWLNYYKVSQNSPNTPLLLKRQGGIL